MTSIRVPTFVSDSCVPLPGVSSSALAPNEAIVVAAHPVNYVYRNFTGVNYAAPNGPQTATIAVIDHEVVGCLGGPNLCSYKDALGFDVTEDQLRWVANQYVAGSSPFWRFRFRLQAGLDWEDRLAPVEAAGLLLAVDSYRSRHPIATK